MPDVEEPVIELRDEAGEIHGERAEPDGAKALEEKLRLARACGRKAARRKAERGDEYTISSVLREPDLPPDVSGLRVVEVDGSG